MLRNCIVFFNGFYKVCVFSIQRFLNIFLILYLAYEIIILKLPTKILKNLQFSFNLF